MKKYMKLLVVAVVTVTSFAKFSHAQDVVPAAVFSFNERGSGVRGYGDQVSDLLFANLVVNPELWLVERAEMEKILQEAELNLSGMVNPNQATQIGSLTGAKVLITGSVIDAGGSMYIVAKIIGTETSRVLGKSVKGTVKSDLGSMVEDLAGQVAETILTESDKLLAERITQEDRIAAINKELGEGERPVLMISVDEQHVGQAVIDPAAETEIMLISKETGFEVIDSGSVAAKKADILITGEGFSEFAMRRGNLVSVKARLEIKAIDQLTDEVIATDRQTAVVVDLTEQIAGKAALQEAAAVISERLLPKLLER